MFDQKLQYNALLYVNISILKTVLYNVRTFAFYNFGKVDLAF